MTVQLLPYGNQISVAQLLSMTSGMIDTNDLEAKPAYERGRVHHGPEVACPVYASLPVAGGAPGPWPPFP